MKFSIRDLLWFTVVVALAVGWFIEHWRARESTQKLKESNNFWAMHQLRNLKEINKQLQRHGLDVDWEWEHEVWGTPNSRRLVVKKLPPSPLLKPSATSSTDLPNSQTPAPNPPKP